MDDLCEANGTFAINLLKMLGEKDNSRNVFFSPLSISSALAMVFMGAKGNTAAQMSQVRMPLTKEYQAHASFCASRKLGFSYLTPAAEATVAGGLVGGTVVKDEGQTRAER